MRCSVGKLYSNHFQRIMCVSLQLVRVSDIISFQIHRMRPDTQELSEDPEDDKFEVRLKSKVNSAIFRLTNCVIWGRRWGHCIENAPAASRRTKSQVHSRQERERNQRKCNHQLPYYCVENISTFWDQRRPSNGHGWKDSECKWILTLISIKARFR